MTESVSCKGVHFFACMTSLLRTAKLLKFCLYIFLIIKISVYHFIINVSFLSNQNEFNCPSLMKLISMAGFFSKKQ